MEKVNSLYTALYSAANATMIAKSALADSALGTAALSPSSPVPLLLLLLPLPLLSPLLFGVGRASMVCVVTTPVWHWRSIGGQLVIVNTVVYGSVGSVPGAFVLVGC